MRAPALARSWSRLRRTADRLAVYLPVILMGLVALGTYWLARNTPVFAPRAPAAAPTHEPDYFMRGFAVRNFDPAGKLRSEVFGVEGRHYPDTDTLEIDQPRVRAFNERGELTMATAKRALTNGDGSELQLFGDAVVVREASRGPAGQERPRMEIRSEFLHVFVDTEQLRSNRPVVLTRGKDQFTGDRLDYSNLERLLQLDGRVRGVISAAGRPQGG